MTIRKTRWPPWSLIGWDIFDFSSETAERNSTKLDRDLNAFYQVRVFRADRKKKQDGRPGLWLANTFSTSSLKPLNRIKQNLTGSKISVSSTKFVFFVPIMKTRRPPWPLIGWDNFDFSSENAERNSMKLDREQDLNVFYRVRVFRAGRKKQDGRPGLWLAEAFSTPSLKPLNGIKQNLTGSKISMSSTKFVFFGQIEKIRWPPWPLIGWDNFDFSSETHWMEFNETWQEARSQHPLPILCFSGRSEKQDGCFGLWLAETFSTSPLKPLNSIERNLTGSKISTSSTKFVFFRAISKQKWPPWPPIPQKVGTLYSGARYVALWASCLH